jgi:CheY-like chemotaxis protein
MQDTVTISWRGSSDQPRNRANSSVGPGAQNAHLREQEALQAEAWEGAGARTAGSMQYVRILIVDYDMSSADALAYMLRTAGYSATRVAYSGRSALAIAAEFHPQVVLLDLDPPDMSGYEVAQLLRERAQRQDLRLIALTSSREHAGRERARAAGFERYLLTPVTALDLAELLQMPSP